jgi:phosphatidylinositol glycan class N
VGIQIGLTLLAIVVTRSSALSLQAKQGLPLGNQILGWIVLGEFWNVTPVDSRTVLTFPQSHRSSCLWHTACNPTTTTCTGSSSSS